MQTSGNTELDRLLSTLRARKQKRAKRFAVLRWVVKVDYYDSEDVARHVLMCVPVSRRAGLVDRASGETWATGPNVRPVMEALRHVEFTAPERFVRVGTPANLKPKPRRS